MLGSIAVVRDFGYNIYNLSVSQFIIWSIKSINISMGICYEMIFKCFSDGVGITLPSSYTKWIHAIKKKIDCDNRKGNQNVSVLEFIHKVRRLVCSDTLDVSTLERTFNVIVSNHKIRRYMMCRPLGIRLFQVKYKCFSHELRWKLMLQTCYSGLCD